MRLTNLIKIIIINLKKITNSFELKDLKNECVIIGSGPSINNLNVNSAFFKDKDLVSCNFIHKHNKFKSKIFKFYSIIDIDYSKSIKEEFFRELNCRNIIITSKNAMAFDIKTLIRRNIKIVTTKVFDIKKNYKAKDISQKKFFLTGNSLPFLIQIAFFIGKYKSIYLLGVDHFDFNDLNDLNNLNFIGYEGRNIKKLNINKEKLSYINALYSLIKSILIKKEIKIINITPKSKLFHFQKLIIDDIEIEKT